nr:MAG TPA: Large Terminase [Caudoviricetes sp.]
MKTKKPKDWVAAWEARKQLILSDGFEARALSAATKGERVAKARRDYAFFCGTYFPHLATAPSASFHVKAANEILRNKRLRAVYEWARGLAKSSNMSLMIPLWLLLCHKERLCLILVSKSEEMADRLLSELQGELLTNELLKQDYKEDMQVLSSCDGELVLANGSFFYSCGRGQSPRGVKYRGLRPNYIIIDDIDDDELCRNEARVSLLTDWVNEALFGTMQVGRGRFILVGNRISNHSVLANLAANKTYKHTRVNIVDRNGKPSWSEAQTLEEIEALRLEQGERSYQKEYMNNPITEGAIFKAEAIQYCKPLPFRRYTRLICYTDPSFKNSSNNDYKATVLVGKTKEGYYHVLKVFAAQESVSTMYGWLYSIRSYVEDCTVYYYMESNFIQSMHLDDFRKFGEAKGDIIALRGDSRKKPDKFARIEALEPLFSQGLIWFNALEKDSTGMQVLVEQLLLFQRGSRVHDDAPDALEGAIYLLQRKDCSTSNLTMVGERKHSRIY